MSIDLNTEHRILWFDDFDDDPTNDYRFLSNFYVGEPIWVAGTEFETGEHMFQAMKARTRKAFEMVRTADGPGHAKALGRSIPLRDDWEAVKYDVMAAVLRSKFAPDRSEADLLLATGDRLLVEGTYWRDRVWGIDLGKYEARHDPTAYGRNWLGTLLMAVRAELRYTAEANWWVHTGDMNLEFARHPGWSMDGRPSP